MLQKLAFIWQAASTWKILTCPKMNLAIMAFPAPGTTLGGFRVRKLFLGNLPGPTVRARPGAQPTLLHFQKDSFMFLRIRRSFWHYEPRFSECWQVFAGHGHLAKDVEVS